MLQSNAVNPYAFSARSVILGVDLLLSSFLGDAAPQHAQRASQFVGQWAGLDYNGASQWLTYTPRVGRPRCLGHSCPAVAVPQAR